MLFPEELSFLHSIGRGIYSDRFMECTGSRLSTFQQLGAPNPSSLGIIFFLLKGPFNVKKDWRLVGLIYRPLNL